MALGPGYDPHVSVDLAPTGAVRLHVAWVDSGRVTYCECSPGGAVSAKCTLDTSGIQVGAVDENGYPWSCLDIASGEDGSVHVVVIGDNKLLYSKRENGVWPAFRTLTSTPGGVVFPVIAVRGRVVAVACQERCEPGDSGGAVVTLFSGDGGATWGPPERHWAGGKNPRLKFSPAGVLYLLARGPSAEGHNCSLRWRHDSRWSEPERCTDGDGNVGIADLAFGPDGELTVAWSNSHGQDGPEKAAVYLARKRNGQWSFHDLLYHDSSAKPHLHIARDAAGDLFVMNSNTVDVTPRYIVFQGGKQVAMGELYSVADASHFFDLKPLKAGVAFVWARLRDKSRLKEDCTGIIHLNTLSPMGTSLDKNRAPAGKQRMSATLHRGDTVAEKRQIGLITGLEQGLDHCLDEVSRHGFTVAHLRTPFRAARSEMLAGEIRRRFAEAGVTITAVFAGFADEDYSTLQSIEATVGLTPPDLRASHLKETLEIADFAHAFGVNAVGMHLGFLPQDSRDADFAAMVKIVRTVCDHCRKRGQTFLIETGQEAPEVMRAFIHAVARANLRVSFDPANLLIYENRDPTAAIGILAPYVSCVHCKDAKKQRGPGELDVRLGTGDVDFRAILVALKQQGFTGNLIIERHRAPDRVADIAAANAVLRALRAEVWGEPESQ